MPPDLPFMGMSGRMLLTAVFGAVAVPTSAEQPEQSRPTILAEVGFELQPGDVIVLAVPGVPDLSVEAEVQADGTLSLPYVGEVPSAGRSLAEVRDRIREVLASQILPIQAPDGSERLLTVHPAQVAVSVARYRPVYVEGDVVQPGERPFRPGMTVRQAIAGAGGIAIAVPVAVGVPDEAALRAAYSEAWYDVAEASLLVWRLRAEGSDDIAFDSATLPCGPDDPDTLSDLVGAESEIREHRAQLRAEEQAYLEQVVSQIDDHLGILRDQLEAEQRTEEEDTANLAAATDESRRALYTAERIAQLRSAVLTSATRRLQTESALMQLERRRVEVVREIERQDEEAEIERTSDLADALVRLAQARGQLTLAATQLAAAGFAPRPGLADAAPVVTVTSGGLGPSMRASLDALLRPGDVVEVRQAGAGVPASGPLAAMETCFQGVGQ